MDGFMDHELRFQVMEAHRRLRREYGCPVDRPEANSAASQRDLARVAARLGLGEEGELLKRAESLLNDFLPNDWTAYDIKTAHSLMEFHGRHCCYAERPACERCPLLDLCPTGIQQARKASDEEKTPLPLHHIMFPL